MASEAVMSAVRKATRARMANAEAKQEKRKAWRARRQKIRLVKDKFGEWWVEGAEGGLVQATDYEVSLWLELCELRLALEARTGER